MNFRTAFQHVLKHVNCGENSCYTNQILLIAPDSNLTAKIGLFWVGVKYSLLYYQQSGVTPPDLTVGISAAKKTLDNQHDIQ